MNFDPYPEYLTIEQAAAYRGVSVATIRRLLRQYGLGEFTRASMGRQVTIRKSDLDAMDVSQLPKPASTRGRRRGVA